MKKIILINVILLFLFSTSIKASNSDFQFNNALHSLLNINSNQFCALSQSYYYKSNHYNEGIEFNTLNVSLISKFKRMYGKEIKNDSSIVNSKQNAERVKENKLIENKKDDSKDKAKEGPEEKKIDVSEEKNKEITFIKYIKTTANITNATNPILPLKSYNVIAEIDSVIYYSKKSKSLVYSISLKKLTLIDPRNSNNNISFNYNSNNFTLSNEFMNNRINYVNINNVQINNQNYKLSDSIRNLTNVSIYNNERNSFEWNMNDYRRIKHKKKFIEKKETSIYISLNYLSSISYRIVEINKPQFNNYQLIKSRDKNEFIIGLPKSILNSNDVHPFYSNSVSLQAGLALKYCHVFYLSFNQLRQGFVNKYNSSFDFASGKSTSSSLIEMQTTITIQGIGLGYKYIGSHKRIINPVFDFNLVYNKIQAFNNYYVKTTRNLIYENSLNNQIFYSSLGFGPSINICPCIDFNIVPTFIIDWNAMRGTELNTRFYNLGLNCGIAFRMF